MPTAEQPAPAAGPPEGGAAFRLRLVDALRSLANPVEIQNAAAQLLDEWLDATRAFYQGYGTFLGLVRDAPFGVYLVDAEFRLAQVSAGAQKVFAGVRPLLGRDFAEVLRAIWPEPFASEALGRFRHTLVTGEPYHSADTTERRNDIPAVESYDWRLARVTMPDGQFGVVCYFYETTDLRRAAARDAYRARLADALRPLADPVAVQAAACRVLGEYLGADRTYYVEIDEEAGVAHVPRDYRRGDSPSLTGRYRIADFGWVIPPMRRGEALIVRDAATSPLVPEADRPAMAAVRIAAHVNAPLVKAGALVGALCVTEPVPREWQPDEVAVVEETAERIWAAVERARAEAALRASEERFRRAADAANVLVYDVDLVCGSAATTYGLAHVIGEDGRGQGLSSDWWHARLHPDDRAEHLVHLSACLDAPDCSEYRAGYRVRHADGSWRHVFDSAQVVRGPDARPNRLVGTIVDITDRKQAEEVALQAEEKLRLALAAARMGTWYWELGVDAHTRDANLNRLLGQPAVETRQSFAEFLACVHPDDRSAVQAAFDGSAQHGRPLNIEFRVVWPDGTVRWLRDQGDVFGPVGAATMSGACVDITDLKEAERDLRQAHDTLEARVTERTAELTAALETLEVETTRRHTLTRLLASAQEDERRRVARDLHDTVGQLLAGLALEIKAVALAGPAPAAAARLDRALHLTDTLGRELHALAVRLRPTALDDLGLEAAVRQLVENWAAHVGVGADFQFTGPAERFASEVETTLFRIVQEALTNVGKHAGARHVAVVVRRSGGHVVAVIEDDGAGFDPEWVTPAPDSERDGRARLGLLGMRERVGLIGGVLEVESAPGRGTTIIVRLPLALDPVQ